MLDLRACAESAVIPFLVDFVQELHYTFFYILFVLLFYIGLPGMSNGPIYLAGKKNKFTFPGLSFDSAAGWRFFDLEVVVVLVVLRMHKNHNEFVLAE